MTRYRLVARQERGILDGTAPVETFDEVSGQAGRGKGLPAVSLLQRVQKARRGDPEVAFGIVGSAATDHPIAAQPHSRLHPAVPTYESF